MLQVKHYSHCSDGGSVHGDVPASGSAWLKEESGNPYVDCCAAGVAVWQDLAAIPGLRWYCAGHGWVLQPPFR